MKNAIFFMVFFTFLLACNEQPKTVYVDVPSLPVSQIYQAGSVEKYLAGIGNQQKDLSDNYLTRAQKTKDKDLQKAVYFYKRSITLYPRKETYLELLELLDKAGNKNESHRLLQFLNGDHYVADQQHYIFGAPDEDLVYEYILSSIRLTGELPYNGWNTHALDPKALRKRLESDERLDMERNSFAFKSIIYDMMDDEEKKEFSSSPEMKAIFFDSFKDTGNSFAVTAQTVASFTYKDDMDEYFSLSAGFGSFLPGMSREYHSFNLLFRSTMNKSWKAVIYSVDSSEIACPKEMRHITHYLAVYDENGAVAAFAPFAWQSGADLVLAELNGNKITRTYYKRQWKKPYKKKDIDNFVMETEELRKDILLIDDSGRIVPLEFPG